MELGLPELLLAAVTVITPILAALINQSKWDSKVKNGVAFGVATVLAVVYLLMTGQLTDLTDIPTTVLTVYGLQQIVYKTLLEKLSKEIEAATSVKPGQTVVVEDDVPNKVIETGGTSASVVIVDHKDTFGTPDEVDETPPAPNYQASHRGEAPLG